MSKNDKYDWWTPEMWEIFYNELKEICLCNKEPDELDDVVKMVNLERLCMANCDIDDLTILENLKQLKKLQL